MLNSTCNQHNNESQCKRFHYRTVNVFQGFWIQSRYVSYHSTCFYSCLITCTWLYWRQYVINYTAVHYIKKATVAYNHIILQITSLINKTAWGMILHLYCWLKQVNNTCTNYTSFCHSEIYMYLLDCVFAVVANCKLLHLQFHMNNSVETFAKWKKLFQYIQEYVCSSAYTISLYMYMYILLVFVSR